MPKPKKSKAHALVGYFDTPADLFHACETLRDEGYRDFDAHTPFPVHGLEHAMGLRPSILPWIVLACAAFGLGGATLMQWWMGGVDYPLNISGKPSFTLPSSIPIMFELTVLCSAFGTFFGMWGLNKLPRFYDPVMKHPSFGRATDDKFFIAVEAKESKYDSEGTRTLLEKLGAKELLEVEP
jgi:hypothetical protein